MKKLEKPSPGVALCLIIAAFGLAFSFSHTTPKIPQASADQLDTHVDEPPTSNQPVMSGTSVHVPVLMYHHVGIVLDPTAADMYVSIADFESQVAYFKNLGYQTVSLAQVYKALEHGDPLPAKPIVFTFDDGYKDVFDNAIPVLQKYGYIGSFAIATELLGRPTYAVWDDVINADKAGMEIVSHTENHLDLTSPAYSDQDLRREIHNSKTILQGKLNHPVDFFVYPYGKYNQHVQELLAIAGYKMAFTTAYGQYLYESNLLAEPRVRVHGQDGLEKLKKIFETGSRTVPAQINP